MSCGLAKNSVNSASGSTQPGHPSLVLATSGDLERPVFDRTAGAFAVRLSLRGTQTRRHCWLSNFPSVCPSVCLCVFESLCVCVRRRLRTGARCDVTMTSLHLRMVSPESINYRNVWREKSDA